MPTPNPYKVFHSSQDTVRKQVRIVLVRPQFGGNVGSTARAMENMGLGGEVVGALRIVGSPNVVDEQARRMAKHAGATLDNALHFKDLSSALQSDYKPLVLASTARVGSPKRPHPLRVEKAMESAVSRLITGENAELFLVFGPEADGLRNDEIEQADWVVTIPSPPGYRSLNLAQAILIFCYEMNRQLMQDWEQFESTKPGQREKLIAHVLQLAETVGFVLPGDPFKMRPRLEALLSKLPPQIEDIQTWHGLLAQTKRSVLAGKPEILGRYRSRMETFKRNLHGAGKETGSR